jgi:hypothetical protein
MQSGSRLESGILLFNIRSCLQRARREARLGGPAMRDDEDCLPAFTDFRRLTINAPLNDNGSPSWMKSLKPGNSRFEVGAELGWRAQENFEAE